MNQGVYRNQTQAIEEIKRMQRIRITTKAEAVAFLRALAPLHEQVAGVLQRTSIAEQHAMNRAKAAPKVEQEDNPYMRMPQAPKAPKAPETEVPKTLVPEDLSSDEGHTEAEIEEKVAKLKKANKANESKSKEKGN